VLIFIFAVSSLLLNLPVLGQQKGDKVYDAVEYPAQPKGGISGFQDYVSNHLAYPSLSLRNKTQGTVEVAFIVEKNGMVSNVEIAKGLDEACNKEAIRVNKGSPKWEPARHHGQAVRQRVTMPVIFNIPSQLATPPANSDSTTNSQLKQVSPEEAARPEGGLEAFFTYLKQNQKYPAKARKNQVQGKVMVEFMVEKDGSLTNFKVLKKMGSGLDEEAIRLIEKGPAWIPAKYNGEKIRQKMILPVIFQL
jgi:protein TonB